MYIFLLLVGAFFAPLRAQETSSGQLNELFQLIQNASPEQNFLKNFTLPEDTFLNIVSDRWIETEGFYLNP